MASTTINYYYVLSGEDTAYDNPSHELKLFQILPGDVVSINWEMVSTIEYGHPLFGRPWLNFQIDVDPQHFPLYQGVLGSSNSAVLNETRSSDGTYVISNTSLSVYAGTLTFLPNYTRSEQITVGYGPQSGGWGPGEYFWLNVWNCSDDVVGDDFNYEPDLLRIQVTLTNPARTSVPALPSQFTAEQKAKFGAAADSLKKMADTCNAVAAATDPLNPEARLAGTIASQLAQAIDPQVGTANAIAQTALNTVAKALENTSGATNSAGLTLKISGAIDSLAALALKKLAADPIDGDYTTVRQADPWSFGTIAGLTTAEQKLLTDSWSLLQDVLNMLSAAERYQGAGLAGDTASQALQDNVFNSSLAAFNTIKQTLASDITAVLPDLGSAISSVNLSTDTSYSQLITYLSGLSNATTGSEFLKDFISSIEASSPYLTYDFTGHDINYNVGQAVTALQSAAPPTLSGTAYDLLSSVAAQLTTGELSGVAELQAIFSATAQNTSQAKGLTAAYDFLGFGVPSMDGYKYLINSNNATDFGAGAGGPVFNDENIYINVMNALYQGNATAHADFDSIAAGKSLQEALTAVYQAVIPEACRTTSGLDYFVSQAGFYQARAAELGIAGTTGAALVGAAALIKIAVDNDISGIGDSIRDIMDAVADGSAQIAQSNAFTAIEVADSTHFDGDDNAVPASAMFTQAMFVADDTAMGAQTQIAPSLLGIAPEHPNLIGIL